MLSKRTGALAAPLAVLALSVPALPQEDGASLRVGDPAPALPVDEWVKGDPVPSFEEGKVYVVEFWATWCGPCIASMPHLSQLQRQHEGDVTIIGVTSRDPNNSLEAVRKMVERKGDAMGYTVAWDADREASRAYMEAAGQTGIPASFVVDKQGKIAYIGHPMFLDGPLAQIVEGTWDASKADAYVAELRQAMSEVYQAAQEGPEEGLAAIETWAKERPAYAHAMDELKFRLLLDAGKLDAAYAHAGEMVDRAAKVADTNTLNQVAWMIVAPDTEWERRDLDLAMRAAEKANELERGQDASILDTLARVHFRKGDVQKAVELQRKAVELADGRMREALQEVLREYEANLE